jgi:zinc D-Ala-D-Ala carboxypeptidase
MRDAAAADGVVLQIFSAFRGVEYQLGIVKRKLERSQKIAEILRISAAPGYSEHHSGRALDITTPGFAALEEEFEHSTAFAWLNQHAKAFRFHLSYPRSNPHGIAYEPWHWCWHERI